MPAGRKRPFYTQMPELIKPQSIMDLELFVLFDIYYSHL